MKNLPLIDTQLTPLQAQWLLNEVATKPEAQKRGVVEILTNIVDDVDQCGQVIDMLA